MMECKRLRCLKIRQYLGHKWVSDIMEHEIFASAYFDGDSSLLNFAEECQPLQADAEAIRHEMRETAVKIAFVQELNPAWENAAESPCISEQERLDMRRYASKSNSKNRRHHVNAIWPVPHLGTAADSKAA